MSKRGKPVSFRPDPEVAVWLNVARNAGFNPGRVINSMLAGQIEMQVKHMIQSQIRQMNDAVQYAGLQG